MQILYAESELDKVVIMAYLCSSKLFIIFILEIHRIIESLRLEESS